MDSPRVIRLPLALPEVGSEVLGELNASIDLVASGAIRRMVFTALPGLEEAAASALAHAQTARVAFALSRDESGTVTVHIGPREA